MAKIIFLRQFEVYSDSQDNKSRYP